MMVNPVIMCGHSTLFLDLNYMQFLYCYNYAYGAREVN